MMVQEMTSNQDKYLWSQDLSEWLTEIQKLTDEAKQVEALVSLVSELPGSTSKVLQQDLEEAQTIKSEVDDDRDLGNDEWIRYVKKVLFEVYNEPDWTGYGKWIRDVANIVARMADQLPPDKDPKVFQQALKAALTIESEVGSWDNWYRAEIPAALATQLPPDEAQELFKKAFEEARKVARNLARQFARQFVSEDDSQKTQAEELVKYIDKLSSDKDPTLFTEALEKARGIVDEGIRVYALGWVAALVAAQLPADEQSQLLQKALEAAQAISGEYRRTRALRLVAAQLPAEQPQLLQQALDAARSLAREDYRAMVLVTVAAQLPPEQLYLLQQVLDAARQFEHKGRQGRQASILAVVAAQLPAEQPQLLQQALDAAQEIADEFHRARVLAAVAAKLPENQPQLLQQALDAARTLANERYQARALAAVEAKLPPKRPILDEALTKARKIGDRVLRAEALAAVAAKFPPKSPILDEALTTAQNIKDDDDKKAEALARVAAKFPPDEAQKLFKEAWDTVIKIKMIAHNWGRPKLLAALVAKLSHEQPDLPKEALDAANKIGDKWKRVEVLTAVAAQLPTEQLYLLQQALLTTAQEIGDDWKRVEVPTKDNQFQLLQSALNEALNEQWKRRNKDVIAKALAGVSAHLPPDRPQLVQQAIEAVFKISTKENYAECLKPLAFRFTEEVASSVPSYQFSAALDTIKEGKTDAEKTQFLSALAPRLYPGLFSNALSLISETIINPAYRAEALSNLVPYLSEEQLSEALELVQNKIPGQSHRTEALSNLIPHLPIKQLPQVLIIAETQIEDLSLKARVLKTLAARLAKEESFSISETQVQNQSQLKQNKYGQIEDALKIFNDFLEAEDEGKAKAEADLQAVDPEQLSITLTEKVLELLEGKEIADDKNRTEILIALTPQLLQKHFESAYEIIETIQIESYKAQAISVLAQAPTISKEQSEKLKKLADQLNNNYAKAKALSPFIKQDFSIRETVVNLAEESITKSQKAEILLELACYSFPDQSGALKAIRGLNSPDLQAQYLERLVPHLHPTKLLEAENIAQEIQNPYYKAKALISLACRFPEVRVEARNKAKEFKQQDIVRGIELLSNLAIEVPEILAEILENLEQKQLEQTEQEKLTKWRQKQILVALKPHLPIRIAREIDRERKKGRIDNELWDRALKILRKEYREALSGGSFRNDAAQDEDLLNLKDEIDALANMLLMRDLEPPVAVGILGGWGGGKSYIMHLMQNRMVEIRSEKVDKNKVWLENSNSDRLYPHVGHIYQIKFDAWTYAKSNLWASLMQTIFFELDRQITLEQQLVKAGINPCEANSAKIWQVLYKTSQDDRKYFLEKVLHKEFTQKETEFSTDSSWTKLLWEEYDKTKNVAQEKLEFQQQLLQDNKDQKTNKETRIHTIDTTIKTLENDRGEREKKLKNEASSEVNQAIDSALGISKIILIQRLGKPVFEAIQYEVTQELNQQGVNTEKIGKVKNSVSEVVSQILEKGKVLEKGSTEKTFNISRRALWQWLGKNRLLIVAFFVLGLIAIFLPIIIESTDTKRIGAEIAALIVPLVPAINIAEKLFRSGEKWYSKVVEVLSEYGEQLEDDKNRQQKTEKLVEARIKQDPKLLEFSEKTANLEKEKKELLQSLEALQKERLKLKLALEETEKSLPPDPYASLSNFVQSRIEDKSYEKRLGLMHQVKDDLWKLSNSLLPPANANEFGAKLDKLKKVFPRGPARVVVYIDDLDRCPPDTVVEVLEAVQLLVKTPLFIAVIAIDERYINRALAKHYQGVLSPQGRPSPADYLEKIIQIPYRVTPITESALRKYMKAQVVVQDSATSGTKFNEFSPQEFDILVKCCQEVDLSPRSLKRLTNVYKLFKVLCRTRGHKSSPREQQAIISLLAFSGRYPELMRDILHDIESGYEESSDNQDKKKLWSIFNKYFENEQEKDQAHYYVKKELKKLKHDAKKLIPQDLKLEEIKDIFTFVRRFSFVGDIGYDADNNGSSFFLTFQEGTESNSHMDKVNPEVQAITNPVAITVNGKQPNQG